MRALEDLDDDEIYHLAIVLPLDARTLRYLRHVERLTNLRLDRMIASFLRHIRIDDEAAHREDRTAACGKHLH